MSHMTDDRMPLTVGQVAERLGVTVRTLHHWDAEGLASPSERSGTGYRLYTQADLDRLERVVVYRKLALGSTPSGIFSTTRPWTSWQPCASRTCNWRREFTGCSSSTKACRP